VEIVSCEYDQAILEDTDDHRDLERCEGVLAQIQILLPSCRVSELSAMTHLLWYCLCVTGLSVMMAQLHGPFALCWKFRMWVRKKIRESSPDKSGEGIAKHESKHEWVLKGLICPICWSFWVSLLCSVIWSPTLEWHTVLQYWLGGMGFVATVMLLSPPGGND
jgi:hypothetical protein